MVLTKLGQHVNETMAVAVKKFIILYGPVYKTKR